MKLIKISPKFQITIPKTYRERCRSGLLSIGLDGDMITLRPIEIQEAKSEQEIVDLIFNNKESL